jgi:hypothetical protein
MAETALLTPLQELVVRLEIVTPLLGRGARTRSLDEGGGGVAEEVGVSDERCYK